MNWFVAFSMGVGSGLVSFGGLWITVRQMIRMPHRQTWVTISQLGRLALCTLVFGALSRHGIGAILPALAGLWIARWYLIRNLGVAADGR